MPHNSGTSIGFSTHPSMPALRYRCNDSVETLVVTASIMGRCRDVDMARIRPATCVPEISGMSISSSIRSKGEDCEERW